MASNSTIDEVIIQLIRENSFFYDKSNEKYHKEYRDERKIQLDIISQAVYQIFEVHMSDDEIEKRWLHLVKKFKEEHAKVTNYCPSGSERKETVKWELHNEMLWLQPYLDHMPKMSSDNMDSFCQTQNVETESKFSRKRRSDDSAAYLKKSLEENAKLCKSIEQEIATKVTLENNQKDAVAKYMNLIKIGFDAVPDNMKYRCCRRIISYLKAFVANIKKE